MVFAINRKASEPILEFIAFGVRHHPKGSHAPTVYQLAYIRLEDVEDLADLGAVLDAEADAMLGEMDADERDD